MPDPTEPPRLPGNLRLRLATNGDCEAIRALVFGILAEFGVRPGPASTDADLDDIEGRYLRPGGVFEVAVDHAGHIVASVGLLPIDRDACELRKMYVAPALRGRGVGRLLLARMVAYAKARGFAHIELETASVLKQAIHMYTAAGFTQVKKDGLVSRCDQAWVLELSKG